MKRIFLYIIATFITFSSCSEWEPVINNRGNAEKEICPNANKIPKANTTIADLAALYKGNALKIENKIIIKGKVISSDKAGNFYKNLYIQDATGGIEIKIGGSGLYNLFPEGYDMTIDCEGLTLGGYGFKEGRGNGTLSLGLAAIPIAGVEKYQNSYMDVTNIINYHVFIEKGEKKAPTVITAKSDLPDKDATIKTNKHLGTLVCLKGLKYDESGFFALANIDPDKDRTLQSNRLFLSGKNWNIKTWALNKEAVAQHIKDGDWDEAEVAREKFGGSKNKEIMLSKIEPLTVSQGFTLDGRQLQVRTSGFCKFTAVSIPEEVLSGKKTMSLTGILGLYQGKPQLTLISSESIQID